MISTRSLRILFWGLLFAMVYLYAYEAAFTSLRVSTPCSGEHSYSFRQMPEWLYISVRGLEKAIEFASLPSVMVAETVFGHSDFCWEYVVFYPFMIAPQWFGYGCAFGWFLSRRR
jgi:hypothetical protein